MSGEGLSEDEVRELARVFRDQRPATRLLDAATLPRGRHPTWSTESAEDFWWLVSEKLHSGIVPDGRRKLLEAAHRQYPANPVFAAGAGGTIPSASAGPDRPLSRPAPIWRRGPFARTWLRVVVAAGIALVVAAGTLAGVLLTTNDSGGVELRAELAGKPVIDGFTPQASADKALAPQSSAHGPAGSATVPAETVGLYGGTRNIGTCDRDKMVRYLRDNTPLLAAWAAVRHINPAGLESYIHSLTPVVLRTDTLVTNHGYAAGKATSFQAVLQAGTAVLVDGNGAPVVKCGCGNPLTNPAITPAQARKANIVGETWGGFSKNSVTAIQSHVVPADVFVVDDIDSGKAFTRARGTNGDSDLDFVPAAAMDWRNATYRVDCAGEKIFTVRDGTGSVENSGRTYELTVVNVAIGDLAGGSSGEVAVLLSCGASGETARNLLYVYRDGPNVLDHPGPPADRGQQATGFTSDPLSIDKGLLVTTASFPSASGSGAQERRTVRLVWDGQHFVATSLTASPQAPATTTSGRTDLSGTWNGALHVTEPITADVDVTVQFHQNGSTVTGTISSSADVCGLSGSAITGTLDGDKLIFAIVGDQNNTRFEGQVRGDTITGTGTSKCYDGEGTWSIRRSG